MTQDIVNEAARLVKDKFKIDFVVDRYEIQTYPKAVTIDGATRYEREQELKMTLTVAKDYGSQVCLIDLDYLVSEGDLRDGSPIDEIIGGDLKGYDSDMRQALRLAFVIYDGIRYGIGGKTKEGYVEKGWRPRVTRVQVRY